MTKYDNIIDRKYYGIILTSGKFRELFPELTGSYSKDLPTMTRHIERRKREYREIAGIVQDNKKRLCEIKNG